MTLSCLHHRMNKHGYTETAEKQRLASETLYRIRWNDGSVTYKDMVRIVHTFVQCVPTYSFTIYVKGLKKANFLRQCIYHCEENLFK